MLGKYNFAKYILTLCAAVALFYRMATHMYRSTLYYYFVLVFFLSGKIFLCPSSYLNETSVRLSQLIPLLRQATKTTLLIPGRQSHAANRARSNFPPFIVPPPLHSCFHAGAGMYVSDRVERGN